MDADSLIIGAGIAGVSAALILCKQERVVIVESHEPAAGTSGVAAGLFSPLFAMRGRPIWRMHEAIDAFERQLADTESEALFDRRGVLRPARDPQQVGFFKESINRVPGEAEWLLAAESVEKYPYVQAPLGAMWIRRGGAVNLKTYVQHLAQVATSRGVELHNGFRMSSWGETPEGAYANIETTHEKHGGPNKKRITAKRLILAYGTSIFSDPFFEHISVSANKGQTIRISHPPSLSFESIPPVSGQGYIIPQKDHFAVGSSFEHTFNSLAPSPTISQELLTKARMMVPALEESHILDAQTGVRVSVPGIRLPLIDALPGFERTWIFSAFGSKGLLLSPLLAQWLPEYLSNPQSVPEELRLRAKKR